VAHCDWLQLLRSDCGCEPSDLTWSVRSRSIGTISRKWSIRRHRIWIRRSEEKGGKGSPERTSTARSTALEFNSEVAIAVFEASESDNNVQILEAKRIPCSTRSPASCIDGKGRPELDSLAGMFRAWTRRRGLLVLGHECHTRRFRMERRARWRRRGGEEALVLRQSLVGVAPVVGEI
jgi:hypothetical protein